MSVIKLAKKIVFKYSADLFLPEASSDEKITLIKNNLASLYKKFMPEYDGALAQLKKAYDLPKLEKLHTTFAKFVSSIDNLDLLQINEKITEIISQIEDSRIFLDNFIKSDNSNPLFTAPWARKQLASTVERILIGLEKDLIRQLQYMRATTDVKLPFIEVTKRRRMTQTIDHTQKLVLLFGEEFGVNSMQEWSQIVNKDYDLAYDLMTGFLALNRGKKPADRNLNQRVKDFFGR